jgi:UDP-N-acetylmuramate: L-alanyl-gamma-D-glutamyl-meso-diaminopimelate ligase
MSLIPPDGFVAVSASYPAAVEVARAAKAKVETYGLERATWRAEQVHHDGQGAWFDLVREGEKLQRVCLSLGGIHNVENALGATAVAVSLGLSIEEIARGLASFKGVKRRQEIRGEPGGVLVVDDFAHHPTAVRETIKAVSARFPGRPLWAIFEPRSNTSRRNLHQHEYSEAFQGASRAIVAKPLPTDKVPAGEQLDVEALAREIGRNGTPALAAANAEEIVNIARQEVRARDVLLVMSNGAFGGLVEKLLAALAGASR